MPLPLQRIVILKVGIVNYSDSTSPGGINRFVLGLASSLHDNGVDVTVIEPTYRKFASDSERPYHLEKVSRPKREPPFNLSSSFVSEVIEWIKREKPDVVHVNGYMHLLSHQLIRRICRTSETKVVFSPHYDISTSTKSVGFLIPIFNKLVGRKTAALCDGLCFVSGFERSAFSRDVYKGAVNGKIVPIGIEWEPRPSVSKWSERLQLIYCGHLIRRKRVDRLVRLSSKIREIDPEIELEVRIIGEGPEKKSLVRISDELGLQDVISWDGFMARDKVISEIKSSDYFVLLSDSEAFAITVAESLSLGTMSLISDNTALSEFREVGGAVLIGDSDAFGEIAKKILSQRGEEIDVGPFGKKVISWDGVAASYYDMYNELMQN